MKKISIISLFFAPLFFFGVIKTNAATNGQRSVNATQLAQATTTASDSSDDSESLPSGSIISGNLAGINCGNAEGELRAQRCCPIRGPLHIIDNLSSFENKIPKFGCFFGDYFCVSSMARTLVSFIGSKNPILLSVDALAKMLDQQKKCVTGDVDESSGRCMCIDNSKPSVLCDYYLNRDVDSVEHKQCTACYTQDPKGVWTALGCVRSDFVGFITYNVLGWGISIAGLIAFSCILYAAYIIQTSSGNPEKLKKAQETLTSCIVGLLIVIFSIFILRVIGVDVLRIPGFITK